MRPIDSAEAGLAPRTLAGWEAILDVLADDEWHDHTELMAAGRATGLASRTVSNIILDSRKSPSRTESRGRGQRRTYRLRHRP